MIKITIKCPITWWDRCKWIIQNCKAYEDLTVWSAWQIGQDDIYYLVEDKDATIYYLKWNE